VSRSSRLALSLIELLVVIAIIAILIGLLMASVQRAREAANRIACANHLHQIALAFHLHDDAMQILPDAGHDPWSARTLVNGAPAMAPNQMWGWAYQILPFVEQENLWAEPNDLVVRSTAIKAYFCPSRRSPEVHMDYLGYQSAMIDYAGNGGTDQGASAAWFGAAGPGNSLDGLLLWSDKNANPSYSGPIALDEASIPDGLSNTILLGEKLLTLGSLGQDQYDDNEGYVAGYDDDNMRWGIAQPMKDPATGSHNSIAFGSSHPSGFNAAFADGSVRVIHYSVSLDLLRRLCSRNDGQAVPSGDF
jgi:prepilin-type processing-associated H-X9-DG protein